MNLQDVSDSLSMSEDDAGNISDGTDVSETETIRESDSIAEQSNNRHPNPLLLNPNMTRTMMMLPPALRPVPPPDLSFCEAICSCSRKV